MIIDDNVKSNMKELISLNGDKLWLYACEEMSELTKELMKRLRGKSNEKEIIEEACDVLITVYDILLSMGIDDNTIKNQMLFKLQRGINHIKEIKENKKQ